MKRRCVIVGPSVELPDAYEVTQDVATADLAIIDGVWFAKLRPLDTDDEAIASFLRDRGILEEKDLTRLDLDELAHAPGVTRQALQRFVRDLSHSGRYPDANRLQEFIIRRGIFV
jgi:hypothetical protein